MHLCEVDIVYLNGKGGYIPYSLESILNEVAASF